MSPRTSQRQDYEYPIVVLPGHDIVSSVPTYRAAPSLVKTAPSAAARFGDEIGCAFVEQVHLYRIAADQAFGCPVIARAEKSEGSLDRCHLRRYHSARRVDSVAVLNGVCRVEESL